MVWRAQGGAWESATTEDLNLRTDAAKADCLLPVARKAVSEAKELQDFRTWGGFLLAAGDKAATARVRRYAGGQYTAAEMATSTSESRRATAEWALEVIQERSGTKKAPNP
jgi:hypothetical protein